MWTPTKILAFVFLGLGILGIIIELSKGSLSITSNSIVLVAIGVVLLAMSKTIN